MVSKEFKEIIERANKAKKIVSFGIREGVNLELDTVFGVYKITGLSGDDVVTGSGLSRRTFAIHGGEMRDLARIVVVNLGIGKIESELGFKIPELG